MEMGKRPVLVFASWLRLFEAHMDTDYDMEIINPMYHEMVLYRKMYDAGLSPSKAARALMEESDCSVLVPAM
ncbi:MAG: hypothetical protein HY751_07700 [Nitrospinae bacterium]|nr:hypothetical protein [Nitrospinota bacterium]